MNKACPVCGMDIQDKRIHVQHLGNVYVFCSCQCRENFQKHPGLYIGSHAVQREGRNILKHRVFRIDPPLDEEQIKTVQKAITSMMGIEAMKVETNRIEITYDLMQATAKQIEDAIAEVGATLGQRLADRIKQGWIHYTEENELDNFESAPRACCNKPPAKT